MKMYFTDDSLFPENMEPTIITAAPFGPEWLPGDVADLPVTWDAQVQAAVDCYNAGATMLHVHVRDPKSGDYDTRHMLSAALDAGATRDEILFVLKCAAVMSIHSCSLGAPILLEEANAAGKQPAPKPPAATPACDKMKAIGQWNAAWDPFYQLDPVWTDEFMATGAGIYGSGVMPPKETELLSIAFDASYTHMYAPGTRRHIHNALQAGATMEEIMEVLKLCVVQGVQACNLGVPILAEELAHRSGKKTPTVGELHGTGHQQP